MLEKYFLIMFCLFSTLAQAEEHSDDKTLGLEADEQNVIQMHVNNGSIKGDLELNFDETFTFKNPMVRYRGTWMKLSANSEQEMMANGHSFCRLFLASEKKKADTKQLPFFEKALPNVKALELAQSELSKSVDTINLALGKSRYVISPIVIDLIVCDLGMSLSIREVDDTSVMR